MKSCCRCRGREMALWQKHHEVNQVFWGVLYIHHANTKPTFLRGLKGCLTMTEDRGVCSMTRETLVVDGDVSNIM